MICRTTGQLVFSHGQVIRPGGLLPPPVLDESVPCRMEEWAVYPLGIWRADHGSFVVGVVMDRQRRIRGALHCHWTARYHHRAPGDPERRVSHENIIHADLGGQHEFSWGKVDCRHDDAENRNWLVVTYAPGPSIPVLPPSVFGHLCCHESEHDMESLFINARHSHFTIDRVQMPTKSGKRPRIWNSGFDDPDFVS